MGTQASRWINKINASIRRLSEKNKSEWQPTWVAQRKSREAAKVTGQERVKRAEDRKKTRDQELNEGPGGWEWFDWAASNKDDLQLSKILWSYLNKHNLEELVISSDKILQSTRIALKEASEYKHANGRFTVDIVDDDTVLVKVCAKGPPHVRG